MSRKRHSLAVAALALAVSPVGFAAAQQPADRMDAAQQRIQAALDAKTVVSFIDTPLEEALAFLRDQHPIPIILDTSALDELGIATDTPVNFDLRNISLRSALRLMLRELELTYLIDHEVLIITTPEDAETRLFNRVYRVADLVLPAAEKDQNASPRSVEAGFESLVTLIRGLVAADSWDEVGGPGVITSLRPDLLTVSQTGDVHEELSELLAGLRRFPNDTPSPLAISETATQRQIRAALDADADLSFIDTPLEEAMVFLRQRYNVPILLDRAALDELGIATDTPINFDLRGISLSSALRLMLRELELTYLTADEVLLITTREQAEVEQSIVLYPVADLVDGSAAAGPADARHYRELMHTIATTISGDSWDVVGGPGALAAFPPRGVLAVLQTQDNHEQIARLVGQLRSARRAGGDEAATNQGAADPAEVFTRSYQLMPTSGNQQAQRDRQEALRLVRLLVGDDAGAAGEFRYMATLGDRLVLRQRSDTHAKIEQLLEELRVWRGWCASVQSSVGMGGGF